MKAFCHTSTGANPAGETAHNTQFRIWRDGREVGIVEAAGMLSALVRFGQQHPEIDADAEWTVDRLAHDRGIS